MSDTQAPTGQELTPSVRIEPTPVAPANPPQPVSPQQQPLNLQGYVAPQERLPESERPISRADDKYQPVSNLRERIESKRVLRRITQDRMNDAEFYAREHKRLTSLIANLQFELQTLEQGREKGPENLVRLDAEIAVLEQKIVETENKDKIEKLITMQAEYKRLVAAGAGV